MTLQAIEEQKGKLLSQNAKSLTAYCKKIVDKTAKIIEKLEENKSLEEVGRLNALTKTYLKGLELKLAENSEIELEIRDKAEL
jgi:hypothetical protein